jgi:hypothetical protein
MSAVSVRLGEPDLRRIKTIARRLGFRDSDLFRYAVRTVLAQLGPLSDSRMVGRQLLPVFLEAGLGFIRHFELDAARLGEILNSGVRDAELLVEPEDITLISMAGLQESYARVRLNELALDVGELPQDGGGVAAVLRDYLYEKYVFKPVKALAVG